MYIALIAMRITAAANVWRKVEGTVGDRRISRKRNEDVLSSCVAPAYVCGPEQMALTEEQRKVQVYENNWATELEE